MSTFFALVTLTLTRWPLYANLAGFRWRYIDVQMWTSFIRQGFRKLSSDRQTDRQTRPKLYTTPIRGWSKIEAKAWRYNGVVVVVVIIIIIYRCSLNISSNALRSEAVSTAISIFYNDPWTHKTRLDWSKFADFGTSRNTPSYSVAYV